jgi:uncharacterized protein
MVSTHYAFADLLMSKGSGTEAPAGALRMLYVHGFNSSPASAKARVLRAQLERRARGEQLLCPALPHLPAEAVAMLERTVSGIAPESVTLVGSSLGGYYATWLAERHCLRAVLVNPAVRPYELFAPFLGAQKNLYTGEEYELTPQHIEQLRMLETPEITRPGRYLLLVTTGDEVLDYLQAVDRYRGAVQIVVPGGDHGFSAFGDYLDVIMDFAELTAP